MNILIILFQGFPLKHAVGLFCDFMTMAVSVHSVLGTSSLHVSLCP